MLSIMKFGGSSLGDICRLRRAAAVCIREREKGRDIALVVSAMGDTTDRLLELARSVAPEPSARELDALLSTGECASAALMAITLESMGCPAVSLSGWQSGIFTDSRHGEAEITTLTASRLRSALARGLVPVAAGFQGIDSAGDVTTLGRGGSDTTAVALAAALRADACNIYTDVDGIFTADPRLVPEARLLGAADTRDMLRLSYAGAQVLYSGSLELSLEKGVEIRLLPASGESGGTLVKVLPEGSRPDFAGLALRGDAVSLVGRAAAERAESLAALLRSEGFGLKELRPGPGRAVFTLPQSEALPALRLLHAAVFGKDD